MSRSGKRRTRAGQAILELTLMMPWIFFLFVGALDFGFYTHALISVQNAARVAALNAGLGDENAASQPYACTQARQELSSMPNAASFALNCLSGPLIVRVTPVTDLATGTLPATRVQVSYQTVPLIPIPGLLTGGDGAGHGPTITRTVETLVFGE